MSRSVYLFLSASILASLSNPTAVQSQTPYDSLSAPPAVLWRMAARAPFIASPTIAGQTVYVGSLDSQFYAINLQTGKPRWVFSTRGEIRSTAAVAGDLAFFVSGDGSCYALDAKTGKEKWRTAAHREGQQDFADYYQSSPLVVDSFVYVGFGDGSLDALSLANGHPIWQFLSGGAVHVKPAVDGEKIFFGSFDGHFYALNRFNGDQLWSFKTIGHRYFPKGEVMGNPVVGYGLVHFGARDYNEYSLDADSGFAYWNKRFPRGWGLALTLADSVLYIGTSDDRVLIACDPSWGTEFWRTNVGFNIFGPPTRRDSVVYVGTLQGRLFAINATDGKIKWSFTTDAYKKNHLNYFKPDDSFRDDIFEKVKSNEEFIAVEYQLGAFFSSPAVADSAIVISSADGTLYRLKCK